MPGVVLNFKKCIIWLPLIYRGGSNKIKLMEDESKLLFIWSMFIILYNRMGVDLVDVVVCPRPLNHIVYRSRRLISSIPTFLSTCIDETIFYFSIKQIDNISLNTTRHYDMHIIT